MQLKYTILNLVTKKTLFYCIFVQNFNLLTQSVDELQRRTFSPSWEVKMYNLITLLILN